jgi:hypothetical protein
MARKHTSVEGPPAATAWQEMLGGDPVPWLLSSDEPAARWVTLTAVLDQALTDPAVLEARETVVSDTRTHELVERLPDWASGVRLSGQDSPAFTPHLLADLGVRAGDFAGSRRWSTPCWPIRSQFGHSISQRPAARPDRWRMFPGGGYGLGSRALRRQPATLRHDMSSSGSTSVWAVLGREPQECHGSRACGTTASAQVR